jgi:16S rRNA (cytosine1402-N4)-methyltransferase
MHRPIMVAEVLDCLRPEAGDVAVDCTLGGGGHARAILEHIRPGGRLIGLDVDPLEQARTEARLRADGFGSDVFVARQATFAGLPQVLAAEGIASVNVAIADLGVSSMQIDDPARGFGIKEDGPLDMRMHPGHGLSAAEWLARASVRELVAVLRENADEPHAEAIARALARGQTLATTRALAEAVRRALPAELEPEEAERSVRRTFQAVRIEVNRELEALEAWLRALPGCLRGGGRVAVLTFHSGEDRRVKHALRQGLRDGTYAEVCAEVVRPSPAEQRSNPRSSSAKLRWARKA